MDQCLKFENPSTGVYFHAFVRPDAGLCDQWLTHKEQAAGFRSWYESKNYKDFTIKDGTCANAGYAVQNLEE